jgi:hypothetical protein
MMHTDHDDQPFLVEGKLTHLHWELGRENLLAKVNKHYKGTSVITGVGAAVGDMFGQVANSAMLAMYDGDDTQNFMCLIDDQPACGQFGGAEHLPEGGNIKAAVSRREGVLYVHAAMDEAREMVWINHPWGTRAELRANAKLGFFLFLFVMLFFASAIWWLGPKDGDYFKTFLFFAMAGGGLMIVMTLWSFKDLKSIAGPSTKYFRLLGFENPESVNLNFPYKYAIYEECLARGEETPKPWDGVMCEYESRNIYSLRAAIKAGKAKLLSPMQDAG